MLTEELLSRSLRWDDARGLAGEIVDVVPEEGSPVTLTMKVARVELRADDAPMVQFSIVLRGPADPLLPQRTYRLRHSRLGDYALLITPLARDATGVEYEACVSHAA